MADKWAEYKEKFCGCKDASRLNSCRGLNNCELPVGHPERKQAKSAPEPVQGEVVAYQIRQKTNRDGSQWTPWRECGAEEYAIHSPEAGNFNRFGIIREFRPLYTAAAKPDAELVKLLNSAFAELEDWRMSFPDANSYETDKILVAIDAKLASLRT